MPLGTEGYVCVDATLPLGDTFFHRLSKVEFQYIFDVSLPDGFRVSTPTLIVLRSFATVLAEAPVSLRTAVPKDNKNDNDQLLLEEVFLD